MESTRSESFQRVVAALVELQPASTTSLAQVLHLPVSTVSRHLVEMARVGWAAKTRGDGEVFYHLTPRTAFEATTPLLPGPEHAPWGRFEWTTVEQVDWRFPLTSRVPDAAAQRVLNRLLEAAAHRGLFHPWLVVGAEVAQWVDHLPSEERPRVTRLLRDPKTWGSFSFVVYGSCARGDARPDSDLDLLVVGPSQLPLVHLGLPDALEGAFRGDGTLAWAETLQDVIDSINVGAARGIDAVLAIDRGVRDLRVAGRGLEADPLPDRLVTNIVEEGMTVYNTDGRTLLVESWRALHA